MPVPTRTALLHTWHKTLNLKRQSPQSWHLARLRDEMAEYAEAKGLFAKLSERSDVLFAISRAEYDGYPVGKLPRVLSARYGPAYGYMLAKYTSRCAFYRALARLCGHPRPGDVREVVNPGKDDKLGDVARRHGIDGERFRRVGGWLRRVWPLFP
ncbi:hypothetical protein GGS20DRAFT_557849 [Poronia punctata]|nr:hypothetical protein GGS20DRAFT_557849 [Poronia punctata]